MSVLGAADGAFAAFSAFSASFCLCLIRLFSSLEESKESSVLELLELSLRGHSRLADHVARHFILEQLALSSSGVVCHTCSGRRKVALMVSHTSKSKRRVVKDEGMLRC